MQDTDPTQLGPIPLDVISTLSGMELFEKIVSGALPSPGVCGVSNQRLVDVREGYVVWECTPPENFTNPMGGVHGGWAMTVLDSALACAVHSALPAGRAYTTIEMKTNLTRAPEVGAQYRCEGRVITLGKRIGTSEAKLLDAKGRVAAFGTTTCLIMDA